MKSVKAIPGQARTCPLCKATILESASVCPACLHQLRFDTNSMRCRWESSSPLRVEGTIRHPDEGEPWEYSVVLSIRDETGDEVARQVVGVGAMKPSEERTFALTVEVLAPLAAGAVERE